MSFGVWCCLGLCCLGLGCFVLFVVLVLFDFLGLCVFLIAIGSFVCGVADLECCLLVELSCGCWVLIGFPLDVGV